MIKELKYVTCPYCGERSHVDDLCYFGQEVHRDKKQNNKIVYLHAECGCDFCGYVWDIEEMDENEWTGKPD